jgi:hypothetical protein
VDVRRSSDDAEESFTAAEVADGTLLAFVNAIPTLDVASNYTLSGQSYETFTNASNSGFSITNSADGARGGFGGVTGISGDVLSVSFDLNIITGSPRMILSEYNTTNTSSNAIIYNESGSFTSTLTATGDFNFITFTEGDVPAEWTISNFKITAIQSNGFVSQWYDQSGNDNHATQGTDASQPKIVDGGSLVSGGMDFDGVNDTLVVAGNPVITANYAGTYSAFSVQTVATNVSGYIAGNASPTNGSSLLARDTSDFTLSNRNSGNFDEISRAAGRNLLSACYNNGDASSLVNGGGSMVDSGTYDFSAGTSDFRIGSRNPSNIFLEGKIEEIIIYNTDQSDNRTAIEANIGDHYDIDLPSGVDTGYDQVDGFVETWYDQSGNGNDAVQQVSGSQPKIVDGGSLVSTNGNPTVDFYNNSLLETSAFTDGSASSVFSVINNQSASATRKLFYSKLDFPNKGSAWNYRGDTSVGQYDFVSYDGSANSLTFSDSTSPFHFVSSTMINGDKEVFINGTIEATSSDSFVVDEGSLGIGNSAFGNGFDIQEIIIYDSDQSANRVAIETNINNQYDIY